MKQSATFFILLLLTILSSKTDGHRTQAYNHDGKSNLQNSKWMAKIPDTKGLSEISIPGSHETMSQGRGGPIAQCQTLSLETQLTSGLRAFDIRCRHIHDRFAIHHGIEFQDAMFGDVLTIMVKFLAQNPSEALLVRVKEEYHPYENTRTFEQTFEFYMNETEFKDFIWKPKNGTLDNSTLTLGNVRGKIAILDDFSDSELYGLDYHNETWFDIQDDYKFKTNWDLYGKWLEVKAQLWEANKQADRGAKFRPFYVNYLSGAYGSFPYFVASGHVSAGSGAHRLATGLTTPAFKHDYPDFPRLNCFLGICTIAFEGTNILTYNLLQQNKSTFKFVGIIMSDFPGDGLIDSIIQLNFKESLQYSPGFYVHSISLLIICILILLAIFFKLYQKPKFVQNVRQINDPFGYKNFN